MRESTRSKIRQDLSQFVGALRTDLATNPDRWENPTLDRFLEAMGAWIEGIGKLLQKHRATTY
jgi:hypothetical protein